MTIQLLQFNTYYNRQYKALPADYSSLIIHEQSNVNFNPNDGVNTSVVLNLPSANEDTADYCLVLEDGEVISKWFILDASRTRLNQYEVVLRRDLLADYYGDVVNAPVFIEKATLNKENPLIFNSEDMTFNQIKTKETLLKDGTGCPWIVGYFSKEYAQEEKSVTAPVEQVQEYITYSSLDEVPFISSIRSGRFNGALEGEVDIKIKAFYNAIVYVHYYQLTFDTDYNYSWDYVQGDAFDRDIRLKSRLSDELLRTVRDGVISGFLADEVWYDGVVDGASKATEQKFLTTWPASGKIIRVGSAASGYEYYEITRSASPTIENVNFYPTVTQLGYTKLVDALENTGEVDVIREAPNQLSYHYSKKKYAVSMRKLPDPAAYKVVFPANESRRRLENAPYDMFAIPYGNVEMVFGESFITNDKDVALQCANAIATAMGGLNNNYLFDLQLLPYCPLQSLGRNPGFLSMGDLTYGKDFTWITLTNQPTTAVQSAIFFPQKSEFSFVIEEVPTDFAVTEPIAIEVKDPKIESQCDTYRLVSPNYNGQFEFNAAKNGGVSYYEVDCTYKPYSPYIHVTPNFGKLYGKDFNDARGLICGGDFSLPTITDQWISYEINNKNYQASFNRQIENMEINNGYAHQADKWAAIAGTVQGITSGATSGSVAGGILGGGVGMAIGAAVGGIGGGIASGIAGMKDVEINQALRNEALDFTIDQFGYSLGNIQALPYSLNRVSSFNINNKIFPIVEYYTCTDTEKEALRNKIKYNGMTVMTIGTIANYLQDEPSYIKGKLIRLEGLNNHTTKEIANELNKGFYI